VQCYAQPSGPQQTIHYAMPRVVRMSTRVLKVPSRFPGENNVLAVAMSVGASVAWFYVQTFALAAIIGTYLGVFTAICAWPGPFVNSASTVTITPLSTMLMRTWRLLGELLYLIFMLNKGALRFAAGYSAQGIIVLIATAASATLLMVCETRME
jgi:hypothetical protein